MMIGCLDAGAAVRRPCDQTGLVGPGDIMDNIGQIRALSAAGYAGPFSFEPFSKQVHELADPARALRESMSFVAREADIRA